MATKKTIKKVKKPDNYKIVLDTTGLKYESEGNTASEALDNLNLEWNQLKGKGVLTISKGKFSYSHLFYLKQLKRIAANKLTRLLWGKRLVLLLGEQKETATMKSDNL